MGREGGFPRKGGHRHQAGEAPPVDKGLTSSACSEPSWCLEVQGYSCVWSRGCLMGHGGSHVGPCGAPSEVRLGGGRARVHLAEGTAAAEAWCGGVGVAREKVGTKGTGS